MIKVFLVLPGLIFSFLIHAQSIEYQGGLSINRFYDSPSTDESSPHYNSYYESRPGGLIGVVCHTHLESLPVRVFLNLHYVNGFLEVSEGGLGGSVTYRAETSKLSLNLGFVPIRVKVFKKLTWDLGLQFNFLLQESVNGDKHGWNISKGAHEEELHPQEFQANPITFGFNTSFLYEIELSEKWSLVPQYSFYIGMMQEYTEKASSSRLIQDMFILGARKKIGTKHKKE